MEEGKKVTKSTHFINPFIINTYITSHHRELSMKHIIPRTIMTFVVLSTVCLVNGFTHTIRANVISKQQHALSTLQVLRTKGGSGEENIVDTSSYSSFGAFASRKRINGRDILSLRQFQRTATRLFATAGDKARVLFLGTPDVAATSLEAIVEESKKDGR